ncbi:hypothetical protein [Pseudonocardia hydrocarbonoxydans]|uniref:HTH domain-containing protein n=1 Tax=Pseudonocardia hydrocarbonoxydans TaxID=76726 RepID=A0A4Y3WVF4_9PSEU|nr:hypothetical protein [Pseudonocardia hydrocarbonoxydans]GEC22865.1 hypothetical protein PHY01_51480 [Pseudonocardia hydrocarbonoxydans]
MNARARSRVNATLTTGRTPRVVENSEFAAFGRRVIRAAGRRIAAGDVEALPDLAALSADLDAAIGDAVTGLRAAGYSWGEIASRLGVSRQAAHQRWASGPASREVA